MRKRAQLVSAHASCPDDHQPHDSAPSSFLPAAHVQEGWTALIVSAQYGHLDTARLLLDSKADINAATTVRPRSSVRITTEPRVSAAPPSESPASPPSTSRPAYPLPMVGASWRAVGSESEGGRCDGEPLRSGLGASHVTRTAWAVRRGAG